MGSWQWQWVYKSRRRRSAVNIIARRWLLWFTGWDEQCSSGFCIDGHPSSSPAYSYKYGSQKSSSRPYKLSSRQKQHVQSIQENNQGQRNLNMQNSAQLAQMEELQKTLNKLREENEKMKASLQAAVDAKLAKEGEVSILRKSIEKNAQSHATQIFQLKTEKEKGDVKQAQMQKELKDEMERLRTEFTFRQQELEASLRKPPSSVRVKKFGRDFPSTPLAVSPAMRSWTRGGAEATGFRKPVEDTPIRLPFVSKASPTKSRKSPEKLRSGMLPGFENAFETSTPRRSPSKRIDKGKMAIAQESSVFGPDATNGLHPLPHVSQGPSQFQHEPVRKPTQPQEVLGIPDPSGPSATQQLQPNDDDMEVVAIESDEDPGAEEMETIDPINWKAELCRIILTHSYTSTNEISFQQLLSSGNSTNEYAKICARILEVISNPTKSDDYDESINIVATSLLCLLADLNEMQQLLSLAILSNLLMKLVLSLPKFQDALLACRFPIPGKQTVSLVEIICAIVSKHLQPTADKLHWDKLALETLSLLECLCFHTSAQSMSSLEVFARNREVLMILLHSSQPLWLLESSLRLLVLLSTYHDMYKVLLDIPSDATSPNNDIQIKDELVERLCSHLLEPNRSPSEDLKLYVLTYFAQLSISHTTSHGVLSASHTFIPSLVLYISQLTTPLWEDDGSLALSPESTSLLVQALNQAAFLLYHLIFGIEPNLNLRHILQRAPHRPFNSINHIFVVTFGRLSYSEPPSWMDTQVRLELEFLAEISREILEVVVDGPEGDSVWAAFQVEPDEENAIDEEEMEAQLMGGDS
ncbi:hypothetical protein BDN70DRAFT_522704 [Pholiota conissans]|uniref:Uncharacterized protein n=1 Tax=Pholiota conissans TaxID=109636 RepID=A0A9P5Z7Q5_9AGAR|nr:hypothetical protein BDN70DRAFT_522704 [Pholiota conissans]